ncbi:MAG: hypothetical protein ACTS4T_01925 [Candidatus Hodgkinia cicadicola]
MRLMTPQPAKRDCAISANNPNESKVVTPEMAKLIGSCQVPQAKIQELGP